MDFNALTEPERERLMTALAELVEQVPEPLVGLAGRELLREAAKRKIDVPTESGSIEAAFFLATRVLGFTREDFELMVPQELEHHAIKALTALRFLEGKAPLRQRKAPLRRPRKARGSADSPTFADMIKSKLASILDKEPELILNRSKLARRANLARQDLYLPLVKGALDDIAARFEREAEIRRLEQAKRAIASPRVLARARRQGRRA